MQRFKHSLVINQCHIYTIKVELVYNFSISPISTIKLVWHSSLKLIVEEKFCFMRATSTSRFVMARITHFGDVRDTEVNLQRK